MFKAEIGALQGKLQGVFKGVFQGIFQRILWADRLFVVDRISRIEYLCCMKRDALWFLKNWLLCRSILNKKKDENKPGRNHRVSAATCAIHLDNWNFGWQKQAVKERLFDFHKSLFTWTPAVYIICIAVGILSFKKFELQTLNWWEIRQAFGDLLSGQKRERRESKVLHSSASEFGSRVLLAVGA